MTTSIFNKIDSRIDGVSQSDILKDEEQMENISEAIQKLQDTEKISVKIICTPRKPRIEFTTKGT